RRAARRRRGGGRRAGADRHAEAGLTMAGGNQRVYRQRIRSTQSLKKIFRAMELIAASRIGKARGRVAAALPYSRAITRAVSAVASRAGVDHPPTTPNEHTNKAAVLIVTADRGMAGAYSASVLREAERLLEQLRAEGKEPVLYVTGRRGISYFRFRNRPIAREWQGGSDAPTVETAREIADTLLAAFLAEGEDAVAELHVVHTQFVNMVVQTPRVVRMLPLEVVEGVAEPGVEPLPLYDFEPSPDAVLDALLPRYVQARIYNFLL